MEFTVELYVSATGHCPVEDFLRALAAEDPKEYLLLAAAFGAFAGARTIGSRSPRRWAAAFLS